MSVPFFAGWCLAAYLIGSISWSYFIVKRVAGIDLREQGSGNLGATNAGRVLGMRWAVIIYLLDFMKGLTGAGIPILLFDEQRASSLGEPMVAVIAGLITIMGHVFPFYLNFKGGKGVATGSGVLMAIAPLTGLIALGLWAICLRLSRMVSFSSIVAALALPGIFPLIDRGFDWWREGFLIVIAIFVVVTHRSNIGRILRGEESRIGAKKA